MLSNKSQLKCLINDKEHVYICDFDTPLAHVKEALSQFQNHVQQIEDYHSAKLKAEEESKATEEPVESVNP